MNDLPCTALANKVHEIAEEIANLAIIYQTSASPMSSAVRGDLLPQIKEQMDRLLAAWMRLELQHRLEAFDARIAEIDRKEHPDD